MQSISIIASASLSAVGHQEHEIRDNYKNQKHGLTLNENNEFIAKISNENRGLVDQIKDSNKKYKNLDTSVLYALLVARKALSLTPWTNKDVIGVGIGSSRGATGLFEKYYKTYLENKKLSALSSPTTTLGNISSWVAHDLGCNGPEMSHSVTCSSGLYSVLNACAWINSGMCSKFIVGGSEAPLTPFTIAQMQALGIYANNPKLKYPCQSLNPNKNNNSMVLGEGSAVLCLEKGIVKGAQAHIIGIGYATEIIHHNTSISVEAKCLQQSMQMALKNTKTENVDVVISHTPGTIKGDKAEINAINAVFQKHVPAITTNKWKVGHTLATSGLLSIEMALIMLKTQVFIPVPFLNNHKQPKRLNKILVNAVGFGGNAVSILISKPEYHS